MQLRTALWRAIASVLTIVIGVALGLPLLLWALQERLIFLPPDAPAVAPHAVDRSVQRVTVPVGDGLALGGWLARPTQAGDAPLPLLIYFGGNAEEVSWMAEMSARFPGWSLLAVNYRGYGGNPGSPGERAIAADAIAIHDWAQQRPDVEPGRIVVLGRSLGSGAAVHLAAARKLAGVVLVTPFDSLTAVAQNLYRFIPVGWLLRHPFDSLARAPVIDTPLLTLAAANDTLIPPAHARRLFDAWRGPRQWQLIAGADHNSIDASAIYWDTIRTFLAAR